ncbi:NAD(P)-dependent dehydrogenase (short-subunit alcohol dehydrogenase family) [Paenibacillus sp. SORGH_AS306]|uniref:SDR family oxidoreductase n=1 Tax=unclassified Paenibacillus TaxID=185978 RepID=UPI002785D81E|nr:MULTISPECIES: SDR family oxidoreductase [unclassified Paenibacillus]MDQ1234180.1 NAD(P)-dependent dehydrogenase (short-subunit alcohol dehydrogenase family) [Paenibacillus sp. SORGH_AS_0306]MDR6111224.1 NAD(P)-dependent dehydrogenase (short-subunit alcohol dehydrogenase family) [Paenibacillus sp. SORGH_AS_0338]
MDISKQVVIISGANRGLGKQLALELLSRGAKVYAGARKPESVDLPGAIAVQLDITDPHSVMAATEIASDATVLINNAGTATGASLLTGNLDDIHLEFNTHLFGTLSMVRAFAPIIEKNGGGSILNILSVLSWVSIGQEGAYTAAKAAAWGLTNVLRLELAPKNIKVAGLHVGFMDTDMMAGSDAPKSAPEDIAKIAVDGIEADHYEILGDEISQQVQQGLAGGIPALYPQLFQ